MDLGAAISGLKSKIELSLWTQCDVRGQRDAKAVEPSAVVWGIPCAGLLGSWRFCGGPPMLRCCKGWFGLLFKGRNLSVLVADYVHTLPLPVFFYLILRGQTNSRINVRTIRFTCPLLFTTCSNFLTYQPTHTLFKDIPICAVLVYFTCFWNFRQARNQQMKRARKAKRSPHHPSKARTSSVHKSFGGPA